MAHRRVQHEFDVFGAKNFNPADYISGLYEVMLPFIKNTKYENSVVLLRDLRSGMRLRRLVELDMFPPKSVLIDDYIASGLSSWPRKLCAECMPRDGKCGTAKYISSNEGYKVLRSKSAKDCMQKVEVDNRLSLCPESILNVCWGNFVFLASELSISYVERLPEIKALGNALKDGIIENYKIFPRPQ